MTLTFEPVRKNFTTSTGDLSYLEWNYAGDDAPVLHFAHANGMNAQTYTPLLNTLADNLHIYAWDARGHGKSSARAVPEELSSWDVYVQDFREFLDFIGKPVFLAGHSLGGIVSLKLSSRFPDYVNSLILFDPVMFPPRLLWLLRTMKFFRINHKFPIASQAAKRRYIWPNLNTMFESYKGRGAFKSWPDEWIHSYLNGGTSVREDGNTVLSCHPTWEAKSFSHTATNIWKDLAGVKCPVTCIWGKTSNAFLKQSAEMFSKINPEAKVIGVENASHFVVMEYPEICKEEILKLCKKG